MFIYIYFSGYILCCIFFYMDLVTMAMYTQCLSAYVFNSSGIYLLTQLLWPETVNKLNP